MAGGVGSRLWPFSRKDYPKQFHDILGTGRSLLQHTADRFKNTCPEENIYVVTNAGYKDMVKEQLPYLADDQILLEPIGRNTAPCIAYACYKIASKNADARIVVSPSDHLILKEEEFERRINIALEASTDENLITLGIKPSRPDTGYGYIQFHEQEGPVKKVKTFTEKPQLEMAKQFVESGDFVWNAGIFVFTAKSIISAFETYEPDLADTFTEGNTVYYTDKEEAFIEKAYANCKSISIDYAVMENAENVMVVLSDIGWSDLGTWNSLYSVREKTEDGNVIDGDVLTYDTENCIIKTPKDRLVVVQGLKDVIIAEYDNVLMICNRNEEQKVKQFVADVKEKKEKGYY